MAVRFPKLSEDELSSLLKEKTQKTQKATKTAVNVFRQYLGAKQINEDDLVSIFCE